MSHESLPLPKSSSPQMFNRIAVRYDFLNRLLSFGLDISWRNKALNTIVKKSSFSMLDIATGTGDVLIEAADRFKEISKGVGLDMAEGMLAIAYQKAQMRPNVASRITFVHGDAQALPFEDHSFDVITISFGIRNIPDLRLAFLEISRVLKPQGQLMILEFSKPKNPILALGHQVHLQCFVPLIGYLVSGDLKAYQYLNKTIQSFPYGERFCHMISQFGFSRIKAEPLLGGVATIYTAFKEA